MTAEFTIPQAGTNGVLATMGGRYGGWAVLMQDGKPHFVYAYSNQPEHKYRYFPINRSRRAITSSASSSTMTAVASARAPQPPWWSTKNRRRKGGSNGWWRSASPAGGIREQNAVPVCRHPQKICCSARTVEAQCRGTTAAVRAIGQRNGGRPLTGKLTMKALRDGPCRGITPAGVLNQ